MSTNPIKSVIDSLKYGFGLRPVRLAPHLGGKVWGNDQDQLICPSCGCPNNHLLKTSEHRGGSDEGRLCVELFFDCESGHRFIVDFRQHKGQIFVEMLPTTEERYSKESQWWDLHNPKPPTK